MGTRAFAIFSRQLGSITVWGRFCRWQNGKIAATGRKSTATSSENAAGGKITKIDNGSLIYGQTGFEQGGLIIASNNHKRHKEICLQIKEISQFDQAKISTYVDVFASNLIYLQVLLDTMNSDENHLLKLRRISEYLGYEKDMKLALLRKTVQEDYRSLQWL